MDDTTSPHDLNLLAAFAENRLDAGERSRVVDHLSRCADCRETVAELVRAGEARGAGPVETRSMLQRPAAWLGLAAAILVAIGLTVRFGSRGDEPPRSVAITPTPIAPVPTPTPPPSPTPAPSQPPAAPTPEGLLARRSGERIVAGKTFRLVAGEWIDSTYDRLSDSPVVSVSTAADRDALVLRIPALKPFIALGNRVTVVFDDTVYRINVPLPD